jgi:hypothetical protein
MRIAAIAIVENNSAPSPTYGHPSKRGITKEVSVQKIIKLRAGALRD